MEADFYKFVDENKDPFITRLANAVKIPSVSAGPSPGTRVRPMAEWLKGELDGLKVQTMFVEISDIVPGASADLPPLVVGRLGEDTARKTVLVYGHYDVQPAHKVAWKKKNPDAPDPFQLTKLPKSRPTRLVGRGVTDDKGPITGWLNVLEGHKKGNDPPELPVNIRFLFEGLEEQEGDGVEPWITREKDGYLKDVDYVCITDDYWLTTHSPSLTYGLRGVVFFTVVVTGSDDDLHSGTYGRMVHEPMIDLIKLLATLVDKDGVISIPGVERKPIEEEIDEVRKIGYTVDDLVKDLHGGHYELTQDPVKLLLGRTNYPSLSIHNIEGGRDGTIISREVTGTFSIRLVKPQEPREISSIVQDYLYNEFDKLNTRNTLKVTYGDGAAPWIGDKNSDNYKAGHAAIKKIFNKDPVYPLDGGSIPLADHIEKTLNKKVVLLPMGRSDDGAHSLSEKLDIDNYINGTKLYGSYLYRIAGL